LTIELNRVSGQPKGAEMDQVATGVEPQPSF
jgi:hypothetical protein